MGDPKKRRKNYSKPAHPWQKERIDEEKAISEEYGLKNKKEIWKADSLLRNFKRQAKRLITLSTKQADVERKQLLARLVSLSLVKKDSKVEDVLGIDMKAILDRRLQTIVVKRKLARSVEQARQFITHRHIGINDKVISIPSYLVSSEEESKVVFRGTSTLSKDDHPERSIETPVKPKRVKPKKEGRNFKGRK